MAYFFNYGSIYTSPLVLSVCVNNQLISQKIENMLCYHALNPAHVPFYVENSHTLASTCTCRIRRADIEVSNEDIIVGIISSPTCYPLSNYFFWLDSLIDNPVHYDRQMGHTPFIPDRLICPKQSSKIYPLQFFFALYEPSLLFRRLPPQQNCLSIVFFFLFSPPLKGAR